MGLEDKEVKDIHTLYTDAALTSDFPSLNLLYRNIYQDTEMYD